MTKIYQLRRRYAAYFETKYCNVVVPMEFKAGIGNSGENKAELITTDRFTQDAIEHDPRYGKEFFLVETYGEPDPEPVEAVPEEASEPATATAKKTRSKKATKEEKPVEAKVFPTMNDAIYYLEEEVGVETSDANIKALMKQYNITVKE